MRAAVVFFFFLAGAAAYVLPSPAARCIAAADHSHRARGPTLGFFEDLKKGFDAGQAQTSKGDSKPKKPFWSGFTQPGGGADPTWSQPDSGEGVLWSIDFSRAWRSKNDMPQEELTVAEAKQLCEELSIPIPPEVQSVPAA